LGSKNYLPQISLIPADFLVEILKEEIITKKKGFTVDFLKKEF
jgi:hypothetical protein